MRVLSLLLCLRARSRAQDQSTEVRSIHSEILHRQSKICDRRSGNKQTRGSGCERRGLPSCLCWQDRTTASPAKGAGAATAFEKSSPEHDATDEVVVEVDGVAGLASSRSPPPQIHRLFCKVQKLYCTLFYSHSRKSTKYLFSTVRVLYSTLLLSS